MYLPAVYKQCEITNFDANSLKYKTPTGAVMIMLALANHLDLEMATADASSAFLYAELEEELYVQFPDKTYARLLKSLYGLKQAVKCFEEVLREGPTECAEEPRKSPT